MFGSARGGAFCSARTRWPGNTDLVPKRPTLKQYSALKAADFVRHPVWIACHGVDSDEPWYKDTDEETFRPRLGPLPADPSEGMLLVAALATLRDGTLLPGFLTPGRHAGDVGTMQPQVFVDDSMFGFWGGMLGISAERRGEFLRSVAKDPVQVFPVRFEADHALSGGVVEVDIEGWLPKPSESKGSSPSRRRWYGLRRA
jgi:hypothetical protein